MAIHRVAFDPALDALEQPDVAMIMRYLPDASAMAIQGTIEDSASSMWVDDEDGVYCRGLLNRREQRLVIRDLLPEPISLGRRFRVLIPAVVDLAARFPMALTWWIHAAFPDGVNRLGQKDGGELSVKTARDIFGQLPGPNPVVSKLNDRFVSGTTIEVWQIGWTLEDARDKLLLIAAQIPDYVLPPEVGTWPAS